MKTFLQPEKVLIVDVRRPDELTSIGGFPVYLSVGAQDYEAEGGTLVKIAPRSGRGAGAPEK